MSDNPQQSVADSLEVEKKLLPYMSYLLQDLWALGSSIDQILDLFSTLPLSPDTAKVLDLGCGKGAISVQIASKFGFDVIGVDAMPEFLQVARKKSSEYQVSALCTFIEQNIHTYAIDKHHFDITGLIAAVTKAAKISVMALAKRFPFGLFRILLSYINAKLHGVRCRFL